MGQRRACELLANAFSSFRYRSKRQDDELRQLLATLAWQQPRYGYRRLMILLWWEDWKVNHRRVFRIYHAAGLGVKSRPRKRRPLVAQQPVESLQVSIRNVALILCTKDISEPIDPTRKVALVEKNVHKLATNEIRPPMLAAVSS